jgi:vitamin B12 transporter
MNRLTPALSLALTLVSFLVPGPRSLTLSAAGAQQPTRPDTARLDPVVTTASRVPQPLSATPSTTVLVGADLRDRGIARVQDALREIAGVALAPSGGWGGQTSLFLRGGNSGYAKVLVDGIPVNQPGGAIDWANLTTDNVERIEIVRGPASVLYGSDAVSGVVQIFTRRGAGRPRIDGAARGGTNDTREGELAASGGGPLGGFSLGGARRTTSGIYAFNNDYGNTTLSALARLATPARADLALSARAASSTAHIPTDGGGDVVDSNAYRRERRLVLALDAGYRLTPRVEARLLAGTSEERGTSDDQPDSPGDTLGFYAHDETRISRRTADLRGNIGLGPAGVLTAGFVAEGQHVRSSGYSNFGPAEPFDETRANRSYYAQVLGAVDDRVTLSGSVRLDDNEKYGAFTTVRASVVARLAAGLRAHAAAGTAFKEPLMLEVFDTPFTRGNASLNPERTASAEVGLARDLSGAVRASATIFAQRFRDLIQYDGATSAPDPNYFNIGGARADGLELEVYSVAQGPWRASASYTWLHTEVTDSGFGGSSGFEQGKPLVRRPRHSGHVRAGVRARGRFALDATLRYVGRRDDLDFRNFSTTRVRMPGHATADLSGHASLLGDAVLTLHIANLLDRAHQPVFNYPGPGRIVLVGVRFGVGP